MKKRIAFQGEQGAYSEKAALEYFGTYIDIQPFKTFRHVFEAVDDGSCSTGLVPIENSLAGSVYENYDLLLKYNLSIDGEIYLRIVHNLMTLPSTDHSGIKKVYSHPQALRQCAEYLEKQPDWEIIPTYDTAGSAKKVRGEEIKDAGAIASEQAASDYGLKIIAAGIESNHENYTRFIILNKQHIIQDKADKTSIVFSFKDIPGALFKCLSIFAIRDINLLKIESRPLHGQPWKYMFYLDFEGNMKDEPCRNAIRHLSEITTYLKELGSYHKGREII